jgi:hypothetical protein
MTSDLVTTIEVGAQSQALPGCSYIYAPRGQAGEYAPLAANPIVAAATSAVTATFQLS